MKEVRYGNVVVKRTGAGNIELRDELHSGIVVIDHADLPDLVACLAEWIAGNGRARSRARGGQGSTDR